MNGQLRLLYWNPGGVRNREAGLRDLVREQNIQVVLLGETWLRPELTFRIPNFTVYRRDEISPAGRAYRGTAVAVRRDVIHTELPLPPFVETRSIGVEVSMGSRELRLFAAYRPPGAFRHPQDLYNIFDGDSPTLLAGDLNAKNTAWGSTTTSAAGRLLRNASDALDLEVIGPDAPTHVPSDASHRADVLDIVLFKNLQCPVHVEVLYDLDTQHLPILIVLGLGAECLTPLRPRVRTDWDKFQSLITNCKFNTSLSTPVGVEAAADAFTTQVRDALEATSTIIESNKRDLFPARLRRLKAQKRELRKLWSQTRCPRVKTELNNITERLGVEVSVFRGASWDERIDQARESETSLHHLNRQLTRSRPPACPLVDRDGNRIYGAGDRAEILADFMCAQFTPNPAAPDVHEHHAMVESRVEEFVNGPTPSPDGIIFMSPSEVRKAAVHLKKRKAPGPDGIPNAALSMLPKKATVTLTRLFNGILRTGCFPTTWKHGKVIVLPKAGKDRRHPESYRPITLLSTTAKLFERLLLSRVRPSLNLRDEQHGFRAGHSTTHQLTRVIHHLSNEANQGHGTVGVFLDIQKAFDRVWHAGLLYKLLDTPLPPMLVRLIASFLEGRTFHISVENKDSNPRPIRAGVPQGSCLSPLLYALYTNDIPTLQGNLRAWETDNVVLALFADDSAYFISSPTLTYAAARMQRVLDSLSVWLEKWRIAVNVSKTAAIIFNSRSRSLKPLRLSGRDIAWQSKVKYLGCHLNWSLSGATHAMYAGRQARAARAMLRPVITSKLPIRTKIGIYKTYVRSRLTYASPAWYLTVPQGLRARLQSQQNITLRMITRAGRYVRNDVIARDLKTESIKEFVVRCTERMFDRADNGPHPHLRGFAPLHSRPPDGKPLPRELIGAAPPVRQAGDC